MDLDGVPTVRGLICLGTPLPCRYCHLPSYLAEADDERRLHPLHPCCRFWIGQEGRSSCVACANFNARRSGPRKRAQTPPPTSASMPPVRPNSAPIEKKFDEDQALLLVLAALRSNEWVDITQLLPLINNQADLLDQLSAVGVEVIKRNNGTYYRITK